MKIQFEKYHGAGNDFIIIDNREGKYTEVLSSKIIKDLCTRHTGIGADGLMLLNTSKKADFQMVYFNADGNESTMCGNGGRCIVAFARSKNIIDGKAHFMAIDGSHTATVLDDELIKLGMNDVNMIEQLNDQEFYLDTGSPHYVVFIEKFPTEFNSAAKLIRYSERFKKEGVNVNFVVDEDDKLVIRTYERGVEDETLACGTGITAVAVADAFRKSENGVTNKKIGAMGGELAVDFNHKDGVFKDINLTGPVKKVFNGTIEI
jgi:diaminopimelate epimerase